MARTASDRIVIEGMVAPGWEPVRQAFIENFAPARRGRRGLQHLPGRRERSSTCGAASGTGPPARRGRRTRWSSSSRPRRAWPPWSWPSRTRAAGSTTRSGSPPTGRSSPRPARSGPPSASCSPTRRGSSASTSGSTGPSSRTSTAWPPSWPASARPGEPGERQAYHAISLGFYEGELIRRVDPRHRTLGQVFADEIAAPLGLDFYIRLPESMPDSRLAPLIQPSLLRMLAGLPRPILARRLQPAVGPLPLAHLQSRDDGARRPRAHLCPGAGDPVRRRRRHGPRHRPGLRRLRHGRPRSSGCGPRRSRRCGRPRSRPGAASTTPASRARCSSRSAS